MEVTICESQSPFTYLPTDLEMGDPLRHRHGLCKVRPTFQLMGNLSEISRHRYSHGADILEWETEASFTLTLHMY